MTDNPKTWGQMTPEEKGTLLLAHHEGKEIDFYQSGNWVTIGFGFDWFQEYAYRVKPEPKRETVMLSGRIYRNGAWVFGSSCKGDMHRIVFDTIDGEPVRYSIRMEKIS